MFELLKKLKEMLESGDLILKLPIYIDNNATTPVDPRVVSAMLPYFTEIFGNAASRNHSFGWKAQEAVDEARKQVADLIGATSREIVFTSGATESDNLAIKGVAQRYADKGNHIITCLTEHKAVIDTCKFLEDSGFEVTWLEPDSDGRVSAQQVADAITDSTILISIMAANNETGVLHPISEIGQVAKDRGVLFHTDATQAIGKIPINVLTDNIDLLSLSGHKIHGPKGIGALYVRRRDPHVRLAIQIHGGGHENKMRSGTLNVPGIVGLGKACQIALAEMEEESPRLKAIRDRLEEGICSGLDYVKRNGSAEARLPNTLNLSFAFVEGEAVMLKVREFLAVSSGSACTSASLEPSFVLKAMHVPDDLAQTSIRFSLGRFNDMAEIDFIIEKVIDAVKELRDMSPLYEMAIEMGDMDKDNWETWNSGYANCFTDDHH
jgi:cysteine desulfurase